MRGGHTIDSEPLGLGVAALVERPPNCFHTCLAETGLRSQPGSWDDQQKQRGRNSRVAHTFRRISRYVPVFQNFVSKSSSALSAASAVGSAEAGAAFNAARSSLI